MKTVIHSNGTEEQRYSVILEKKRVSDDLTHIKFSTKWSAARNPNGVHEKFELFLSDRELKELAEVLAS